MAGLPHHDPDGRDPGAAPLPSPRRGLREKLDGWCALAYKDGDRVRLVSRQRKDRMRLFNRLVATVGALERGGSTLSWQPRPATRPEGMSLP
jgi:hypothetical protein